jgi:peptidyl-prolyl cis-trans isomerase NIMA-interacting 1
MMSRLVGVALLTALGACDAPASSSAPAPIAATAPSAVGSSVPAVADPAPASAAPSTQPPPTSVAAQHILVAYKGAKNAPKTVTRTKSEARKRAEEVLARIHGGADFTELVKSYSDDPGSAERLGSVGKFTRDKMDKAFADAAFALKVDEVSDVVETPFGFHVIKRNQ